MTTEPRRTWLDGWRAAAPHLPTSGLVALLAALQSDDPAVVQGLTVETPHDSPDCCGACPLAYAVWKGEGLTAARDVLNGFSRVVFEAAQSLMDPEGVYPLLRWVDDAPRAEVRAALVGEVRRELERRGGG